MMKCRGVRGATTLEHNNRDEILESTKELLKKIVESNDVEIDDIASIYFSVTDDLDQEFPALAARQMGWNHVAMVCTNELTTSNCLKKCLRILMHINTEKSQDEIKHIYLRGAKKLRPDLAE